MDTRALEKAVLGILVKGSIVMAIIMSSAEIVLVVYVLVRMAVTGQWV